MPEPDFKYILRCVARFIPKHMDRESIAQEIILRHIEQGKEGAPTFTTIRNACYDVLRRSRKELEVNQNTTHARRLREKNREVEAKLDTDRQRLVNEIMFEAGLNESQRELIFQHFYLDKPLVEIATSTNQPVYKIQELYHAAVKKLRWYCELKGRKL